jgi:hypothetical protein
LDRLKRADHVHPDDAGTQEQRYQHEQNQGKFHSSSAPLSVESQRAIF